MNGIKPDVIVNGHSYRWPLKPTVVICIDGGDPEYFDLYLSQGLLPNLANIIQQGFSATAKGTMPSFTCPNNMSIITGTPASQHGISGNYYLDTHTWQPVVMTGADLLRGDTILGNFAKAGAFVVSITAKDKLRKQLGKGLTPGARQISFSSEFAGQCTIADNGIEHVLELVGMPQPEIYSQQLSLFVLEAGLKLLQMYSPDVMYLSLTDWVQHKYAPEDAQAIDFYIKLDHYFGRFLESGAVLALTADHGMSDKSDAHGAPNVIWLQDMLDAQLGAGVAQVICPITDAYVGHHGSLGGFVRVWFRESFDLALVLALIAQIEGVESCYSKVDACRIFDLPIDREADIVVVAQKQYCIGSSALKHDLSGLHGDRLRTHGGISEAVVPFIISAPLRPEFLNNAHNADLNNYALFDYVLNKTGAV